MLRACFHQPRIRQAHTAVLALTLLMVPLAGAQGQQANDPLFGAAAQAFNALPDAERKAIQADLIWTGHLNSAATGSFGPLTFRALNKFRAEDLKHSGVGPIGQLMGGERQELIRFAYRARDAAGFGVIIDERTGVRIGVPQKLLPKREATATGGSRWQSADGKITLDVSAGPASEPLLAIFERAIAVNPNVQRKVTYKLLQPTFFVVAGETPTGKFFRRQAFGPSGLRGFSVGYDKGVSATFDRVVTAIADSFEPFPTGPLPAASAVASAASAPAAGPVAPPVPVRVTERYGVGLAVADRVAVTAAAALDRCRSLRVGGRAAKLRGSPESGLALLEVEGGPPFTAAALRAEALGERESLVLVAFGEDNGKRAAVALAGQGVRIGAGIAVFAPLQPGQAGAPVFDRQGRPAGLVTGNPSDKVLIAGVAPQRAYAVADSAALQGLIAKAGLTSQAAAPGPELSTGAVVDKVARSVLPIVCGL